MYEGTFGSRPHPISVMALRSDVWSAETLQKGIRHSNGQPDGLLDLEKAYETMSDDALLAQLED